MMQRTNNQQPTYGPSDNKLCHGNWHESYCLSILQKKSLGVCQDCTCVCAARLFCEQTEKATWTAKRACTRLAIECYYQHVTCVPFSHVQAKSDWQLQKWQRELCQLSDVTVWLFSVLVTLVKKCRFVRLVMNTNARLTAPRSFGAAVDTPALLPQSVP